MGAHRAPEPDAPHRAGPTGAPPPAFYPTGTGTTYAEPPPQPPPQPPPESPPVPRYPAAPQYRAAERPTVLPVVLFTALFGIFGVLSASRRATKARAAGGAGTPYWTAFGITLVAVTAAQLVLLAPALPKPAAPTPPTPTVKVATADKLANSIAFTATGATTVTCAEAGVRADGTGRYQCAVVLPDGTRGTYAITVGRDGRWTVTK